jgi:hypothetical protein
MVHVSNPPPPPPMPFRDEHPVATADRRGARPPRWFARLIAGLPALLAVLLLVLFPGFMYPLFDDRIAVLGMPLGLVLLAFVFALSGVGILVVAVARSWLVLALVVIGLVAPALFLLILAPAVVLITINLRV